MKNRREELLAAMKNPLDPVVKKGFPLPKKRKIIRQIGHYLINFKKVIAVSYIHRTDCTSPDYWNPKQGCRCFSIIFGSKRNESYVIYITDNVTENHALAVKYFEECA
jgi:hypothetical protein